jgi:GT2 family glycosyltransferase
VNKLSIVITCYNKWNFTSAILNDLSKLPKDTHEIILVDNASQDETRTAIHDNKYDFVRYIRNDTNLFHSKGCNLGFQLSTGNIVCFLNNDVRVRSGHNDWTNELIKYSDNNIVGTTMGVLDNNFNFIKESKEELEGNSYLSGWCLCSSRENWKKLDIGNGQIFDENIVFYFNDVDISWRAKKAGLSYKLVSIPVVHFGKISASQLNIPKLYADARKIFINKWSAK